MKAFAVTIASCLALVVLMAAGHHPDPNKTSASYFAQWHTARGLTQAMARDREAGEAGPDFEEAYRYFLQQRTNQYGDIDWTALDRAAEARDRMATVGYKGRIAPPNWEAIGPLNLDVPQRKWFGTNRATSGRVTAIAFDPSYNSKTVYLSGAGGGVWKSTDGGDTWSALSNGPEWKLLQVSSLAVDPHNPQTIYAGTGGARGFFRVYGFGVMKSTDGGGTWQNLNSFGGGKLTGAISDIMVYPDDSNIVLATTYSRMENGTLVLGKVYRSTNGGATFTAAAGVPDGVWNDLTIGAKDANGDRFIYASGFNVPGDGMVWRSEDKGASWKAIANPSATAVTAANAGKASLHISASPANTTYVYAVSGLDKAVYRSKDGGDHWNVIGSEAKGFPFGAEDYNWSQSGYDAYITCSYVPGGFHDIVYVGLITVAATSDDGDHWTDVGRTYLDDPATPLNRTHNDQQCLAFNPQNPDEVLLGNDGGVYRMTYDSFFDEWSNMELSLSRTLQISQFYAVDYHPTDKDKALGGTQDNATPRSFGEKSPQDGDAASLAEWNNCGGGDGGASYIDPEDSTRMYTSANGSMQFTTDSWKTSAYILMPLIKAQNEVALFLGQSGFDPTGDRLFLASNGWTYRYTRGNGADNLGYRLDRKVITNPPNQLARVRYRLGPEGATYNASGTLIVGIPNCLAVAPGDGNVLYIGTLSGKVYMSRNARAADVTDVTFTEIQTGAAALPANPITCIKVDPFNQNRVYVGLGGIGTGNPHLYRCDDTSKPDATRNWVNIYKASLSDMDIPVNTFELAPGSGDFYVGNDVGAFNSTDGGSTWNNITVPRGMPNVQVNALKAAQGSGYLLAGTFGRGAYRMNLGTTVKIAAMGVAPNPLKGGVTGTGRVILAQPAPNGGAKITFAVSNDNLTKPADVTIPQGSISATFDVKSKAVRAAATCVLTATYSGESKTTTVQLTP